MVNYTPYDTFGRSSRRQVGYTTIERAERKAWAAGRVHPTLSEPNGAKLTSNIHTVPVIRSWERDTTDDAIGRFRALDTAGNHVGTTYVESGRLFAMVSYPEPGNTAWVVLPSSYKWDPVGLVLARRAVEDALSARAAFLRSASVPA